MAYCSQCGKELFEGEIFCSNCGNRVGKDPYSKPEQATAPTSAQMVNSGEQDVPSTGLNVLSFFFPIVGLILYLVNMDSKPVMAKAIGKWALIGVAVGVAGSILLGIFYGVAAASFLIY